MRVVSVVATRQILGGRGLAELSVPKTEVIMMGMIHGGHRTSESCSLERIRELVIAVDPDLVLCEAPPGRLETALEQDRETGVITEARVRVFPEDVDSLIPLQAERAAAGDPFRFVPCAAWRATMAGDRRAALERLEAERPSGRRTMPRGCSPRREWRPASPSRVARTPPSSSTRRPTMPA